MDDKIKAEWVQRLRSGIPQAKYVLTETDENNKIVGQCCLGVLCEMAAEAGIVERRNGAEVEVEVEDDQGVIVSARGYNTPGFSDGMFSTTVLPERVMSWAGLPMPNPDVFDETVGGVACTSLAALNDEYGLTFEQIADVIQYEL